MRVDKAIGSTDGELTAAVEPRHDKQTLMKPFQLRFGQCGGVDANKRRP